MMLQQINSISDIFKVSTEGGEPIRLTDGKGKYYSPKWFPTGDKIGFLAGGQLWEMDTGRKW